MTETVVTLHSQANSNVQPSETEIRKGKVRDLNLKRSRLIEDAQTMFQFGAGLPPRITQPRIISVSEEAKTMFLTPEAYSKFEKSCSDGHALPSTEDYFDTVVCDCCSLVDVVKHAGVMPEIVEWYAASHPEIAYGEELGLHRKRSQWVEEIIYWATNFAKSMPLPDYIVPGKWVKQTIDCGDWVNETRVRDFYVYGADKPQGLTGFQDLIAEPLPEFKADGYLYHATCWTSAQEILTRGIEMVGKRLTDFSRSTSFYAFPSLENCVEYAAWEHDSSKFKHQCTVIVFNVDVDSEEFKAQFPRHRKFVDAGQAWRAFVRGNYDIERVSMEKYDVVSGPYCANTSQYRKQKDAWVPESKPGFKQVCFTTELMAYLTKRIVGIVSLDDLQMAEFKKTLERPGPLQSSMSVLVISPPEKSDPSEKSA